MAEVPRPVRQVLRSPVDEASYQRMWRAVGVRRAAAWSREARGPHRRLMVVAPAAVLAAAALVLAWVWGADDDAVRTDAPGALALASGGPPGVLTAPDGAARTESFADGSRVTLAAGTTLAPTENTDRSFAMHLDGGRARFEVEPGGPRRWRVDCGLALVEVIGTVFAVERTEERVRVAVEHGTVRVHDRVNERRSVLRDGESLVIERPSEPADAHEPPPPSEETVATGRDEAAPAPSWSALAREGHYHRAWELLGRRGLEREARRASASELLALADVACLSGHPAEAVAPLEQLMRDHPTDANASLAAFTLGVIHMDRLGAPSEAARSFDRALALGLPPSLQEDALARLALARGSAGDVDGAREAAERYLRRFPTGRRRAEVRRWAPDE